MPRVSQRDVLTDRQNPAQPALFDDSGFALEAGALESIRHRRYEHQGARLVEDDAKALRLVELLCLKWGVKKISREMQISAHTVRAARRLLAAQGKLAPYKQRVVEILEDGIEAAALALRDGIEDGTIKASQVSVPMAIMFDKRALALGEPTSIRGTGEAVPEAMRVEDLNAYLERLPSCKAEAVRPAIDLASTGNDPELLQIGDKSAAGATLEASPDHPRAALAPATPPVPVPVPTVSTPGPTPAMDPAAEGGGGGVAGAAPD